MVLPIQYLRAFAALTVLHFHAISMLAESVPTWYISGKPFGAFGVDIFFVISGFVMALVVDRSKSINPLDFLMRRVVRVAPLYFLVTIALFMVFVAFPLVFTERIVTGADLLHSMAFLPYVKFGEVVPPVLLVGWTLNYEMFFYAIVALTVFLSRSTSLLLAGLLISTLVAFGALQDKPSAMVEYYTSPILLEFVYGIIVHEIWKRGYFEKWSLADSLFFLALGFGLLWLLVASENHPVRFLTWGIPAAIIVSACLACVKFKSRLFTILGDWSYALYLVHVLAIASVIEILGLFVDFSPAMILPTYILVMSVSILIGGLTHMAIERPIGRVINGWIDTAATKRQLANRKSAWYR